MAKQNAAVAKSPLQELVATKIEQRIRQGVYPSGRQLPAERALAADLGVSRLVIRAAIGDLESQGLLVRAPGCRPLVQAPPRGGNLVTVSPRHTLALWIMHRPSDGEAPSLLYGIQRTLDPGSHRLLVSNALGATWDAVVESEAQFLARMTEDQDIAGVILWYIGHEKNLPALQKLRQSTIPLVFIDRRPPEGFEADHVGVDNASSAEQAVQHLIEAGHRRIAHITNYDAASTVDERLAGYRRALDAAGVAFSEDLVFRADLPGARTPEVCRGLVDRIREAGVTAVFALNDRIAFELMEALKYKGVRVPQDLAVVGFDGIERWMPGPPFLTTCNQPFHRLGTHAVELLLWRIEEGPDAPYRHVLLEAPLLIHGSSCPGGASESATSPRAL